MRRRWDSMGTDQLCLPFGVRGIIVGAANGNRVGNEKLTSPMVLMTAELCLSFWKHRSACWCILPSSIFQLEASASQLWSIIRIRCRHYIAMYGMRESSTNITLWLKLVHFHLFLSSSIVITIRFQSMQRSVHKVKIWSIASCIRLFCYDCMAIHLFDKQNIKSWRMRSSCKLMRGSCARASCSAFQRASSYQRSNYSRMSAYSNAQYQTVACTSVFQNLSYVCFRQEMLNEMPSFAVIREWTDRNGHCWMKKSESWIEHNHEYNRLFLLEWSDKAKDTKMHEHKHTQSIANESRSGHQSLPKSV